jgi:hypothetical protein
VSNKRAVIQLTENQIGSLLDLPPGYRVLYIGGDFLRQAVTIVVSGDDLTPVPEGGELPILGGVFGQKQAIVDGELYYRWSWTPAAEAAR